MDWSLHTLYLRDNLDRLPGELGLSEEEVERLLYEEAAAQFLDGLVALAGSGWCLRPPGGQRPAP